MSTPRRHLLAIVSWLALAACSPGKPPAKATAASTTPSATSLEPTVRSASCRGAAFDLDALPDDCLSGSSASDGGAFEVRLIPEASSVKAGGDLGVTLEVINTSTNDAELVVDRSCFSVDLGAFRDDKRRDRVNVYPKAPAVSCAPPPPCSGKATHLTIVPQGKVVGHLALQASVTETVLGVAVTWTTDIRCGERLVGPLPAGDYELRVEIRGGSFASAEAIRAARVVVTVTK